MGAILVGTNVLLREGLARILAAAGFRIIASAPCVDDHVLGTLRQEQPTLLIIDLSDDFDERLRQIACFKQRLPAGRIVALADQHQPAKMASAFCAGANAYLVKVAARETFVKLVELIMLGATLVPPEILNVIFERQTSIRSERPVVAADCACLHHDHGEAEFIEADVEPKRAPQDDSGHASWRSVRQ